MKVAEESRIYRSPAMRTPPPAKFLIKLLIAGLTVGIIPFGAANAQRAQSFDQVLERSYIKTDRDREDHTVLNMRKTLKAAENYASHNQGKYPFKLDEAFKSYFPLGNCDGKTYSTFTIPYNPFSKKPAWPIVRAGTGFSSSSCGDPGAVEYLAYKDKNSYKIRARGKNGKWLKQKNGNILEFSASALQLSLANARTVQWAAERYREKLKRYPIGMTRSFKCFFPGGDPAKGIAGRPLPNPYETKTIASFPLTGKLKSLSAARQAKPTGLYRGAIEYSCLDKGKNYAIRIGGKNNYALSGIRGKNSTLVIARDGDGSGHEQEF